MALINPRNGSVLLCEHDPALQDAYSRAIKEAGYREVVIAPTLPEAFQAIGENKLDILVLDLELLPPGAPGNVIKAIQAHSSKVSLLCLSEIRSRARACDPTTPMTLVKPIALKQLIKSLDELMHCRLGIASSTLAAPKKDPDPGTY